MEYILNEEGYKGKGKIKYQVLNNGCWQCTHPKSKKEEYLVVTRNNKQELIHRYIYSLYYGKIREGFVIMHLCDNPKCVNPEHLKEGTQQDNIDDMHKKGRAIQSEETRKKRSESTRGSKNPTALDNKIYDKIIQMLNKNIKVPIIAGKLGVNQETIYKFKRGTHWYLNITR